MIPQEKALLIDSLRQLRLTEISADSSLNTDRSSISIWLDKILSPDLIFLFSEAFILFTVGSICGYLLFGRSRRAKRNDSLQARSIRMAGLAIFSLASKGLFFILATLSLSNVLPSQFYGQLYWLGWQLSMVWFVFFGTLFALGFVRDKKSYDVYFITTLTLLAFLFTLTYNDWTWRLILSLVNNSVRYNLQSEMPFRFGEEYLWVQFSKNTYYAMMIHFSLWSLSFLYVGSRVFRRSKGYQDESARHAAFQLSIALFVIAIIGLIQFLLLFSIPKHLFNYSLLFALISLGVLFYGVRGVYRHGRYRRV